jgi:hypothetical protein
MSGFRKFVVCWTIVALAVPSAAFAAAPQAPQAPVVVDVRLREGGVLLGQVVDGQGTAQAGAPVMLRSGGKDLVTANTDQLGLFAFRDLKQGVYQVASGKSVHNFRVWTAQTAPPVAQDGALVVVGDKLVRGQHPLGSILTHPLLIGGAVAAAIAVPIAIANSDDDEPASP